MSGKIIRSGKILVPAAVATAVLYGALRVTMPVMTLIEPLDVKVEKGMNFREASRLFAKHGLIRDVSFFAAMGRITGIHKKLRPGYYRFEGEVSPWDVFKALREGRIIRWEVTVIEGDTLFDIKNTLAVKGVMSGGKFDSLSMNGEFLKSLNISAPSLEGYLFPDTYSIPKGMEPAEVLAMMVGRLREEYDDNLLERSRRLGLDEKKALTLASIIEKEATVDSERFIISAVYHNRLKKGMPLQADPTAIYGIKQQREGITKKDIMRKTEYNTYFIKGLPPGPIASPGKESIKAALYPADVPYLFFVSNNDGTHRFSVTLTEHIMAVEEYRARKVAGIVNGANPL